MPDFKYLFGPIPSRRIGISLGVNVIPSKVCSFDCLYCESGRTTIKTMERKEFFPVKEIITDLKNYLSDNPQLDYITFSGAGEPSLYSKIGEISDFLKKEFPQYKICLITNSSMFINENFRQEIKNIDLIIPSIDAPSQEIFEKINRPVKDLKIETIIHSLAEFSKTFKGKLWIEIFIIDGLNDSEEILNQFKQVLESIKYEKIQINSLDRPGADKNVKKAKREVLLKVQQVLGEKSEIVSRIEIPIEKRKEIKNKEDLILKTIKIRPMTEKDIFTMTGLNPFEIGKMLEEMVDRKILKKETIDNNVFFRIV